MHRYLGLNSSIGSSALGNKKSYGVNQMFSLKLHETWPLRSFVIYLLIFGLVYDQAK